MSSHHRISFTSKLIKHMPATILSNVILDGKPVPAEDAQVRLSSRLAMYGEGCFDTLRAYEGGFLHPEKHLMRLHRGIELLGRDTPPPLRNTDSFLEMLALFLKSNEAMDEQVRIRVQVWADDHTTGFRPGNTSTRFVITGSRLETDRVHKVHKVHKVDKVDKVDKVNEPDEPHESEVPYSPDVKCIVNPVSLITSRFRRIPACSLSPDVKWTNSINYILAAREAQQKQADDALMLTHSGLVSETTVANIFWMSSDSVFTPSVDCDLLPGITRGVLLDIYDQAGMPLVEGEFGPDALAGADIVWICNSVREICPVGRLDEHRFDPDPLFLGTLNDQFETYKREHMQYVR